MPKLKKYRVHYTYQGIGVNIIRAKDKKEAEKKYDEGDFEDDFDNSKNYEMGEIELDQ